MKTCKKYNHEYEDSKRTCPVCKKANSARWKAENADREKTNQARWTQENAERHKANQAKWYSENRDRQKSNMARYYRENAEREKSSMVRYHRNRKARDPLFKLRCNLRALIFISLRNQGYRKSSKTQAILGADFNTVQNHLILSALNNYGMWIPEEPYHIDHIIPVSRATSEAELLKLNHYSNLQYLYAEDNLAKGDSLTWSLPVNQFYLPLKVLQKTLV
jgi:hypothetical protein